MKVGLLVVPDQVDQWILRDHNVDFAESLHITDDQHDFNTWHSYAACTSGFAMVYGLPGWEKIIECDMVVVTVFGDVNKAIDPIMMLKSHGKVVALAYHEGLQMLQYVTERDIEFLADISDVVQMTGCDFLLYSTPKQSGLLWELLGHMDGINVHYVPYAYPVSIRDQYICAETEKKGIMISYTKQLAILMKQNFAVMLMAAELSKKHKTWSTILTDDPRIEQYRSWFQDGDINWLQVEPAVSYHQFLHKLARHQIALTYDHSLAQGQISYDGALVGVPTIGSSTDGQRMLFPELAFDTTNVDKVMSAADMCLGDTSYRRAMSQTALEVLTNECSFGAVKYRLEQLYKRYKEKA